MSTKVSAIVKSKSTRFCKQHVNYMSGIRKQQGRCGHKKEFECSSLFENAKSWTALELQKVPFYFFGVGSFHMALFSAKLTATGL
jgi:hypothetical protein